MKRVFIGKQLQVGSRVRGTNTNNGIDYEGVVYSFGSFFDRKSATIKRDDGLSESGDTITGLGSGWIVYQREDNGWGSDGYEGNLMIIR
jgi:hypothetical protein